MKLINKITIKYFRSIYTASLKSCNNLNVISGKNDVGKSNILKALNLFFNNESDWKKVFNFSNDFSKNRLDQVRKDTIKGKQFITIEIEFNCPTNYNRSLPNKFVVRKTWSRDGNTPSESNNLDSLNKKRKLPSKLSIAQRSLTTFLNRIHYEYVPAIKDRNYYNYLITHLQATLLDNRISEGSEIKDVAENLAGHIQQQVAQLQDDFLRATKVNTSIKPPEKLEQLFNAFVVSTESISGDIPLIFRGDGVQARYLGSVLHYISSKSPKFFIWGFEEPENSLEYNFIKALATDFHNIYQKDAQIFLTSHSPEFISLTGTVVSKYRIFQENMNTGAILLDGTNISEKHSILLNKELGLLRIQEDVHNIYKNKIEELNSLHSKYDELRDALKSTKLPIIITEGKSDKNILQFAWNKLYSVPIEFNIRVADPYGDDKDNSSAGASSVAAVIETIHPEDNRKLIGIFDYDDEGIKHFNKLSKNFQMYNEYDNVKKHKNGLSYALLLPKPYNREAYYQNKNMCIEFYFDDNILRQKNSDGFGLSLESIQPTHIQLQHKKLTTIPQQILDELRNLDGFTQITNGKTVFAETIVSSLKKEDFYNFKILFDLIKELIEDTS